MLKGVGFTDDDLARPLVGVATTWIETMPCNLNHRVLAGYVKQGIRRAGGTPLEFNTISVSDGVSMGTAGMRASLVSREVIADSIELVARGHLFDGLVCIVGCDKTIPAAVMALARLDLPGLVLYGGSIAPGRYRGRDVTIQDVFEVVGAHAAGTASDAEVHALESVACPGAGACGGQFTANTMATTLDFLGVSASGLNEIPATHPGKPEAAVRAGELAMKLVEEDTASFAGPDARGVRERDRGGRGHRWLDERRLAPARDRRRGGSRAVDRRLRPHLGAHADRRRHQARRPLRRDRPLSRGRRRPGRARARARRRRQRGGAAASTAGRCARSPTACTSVPARTSSSHGTTR